MKYNYEQNMSTKAGSTQLNINKAQKPKEEAALDDA